MNGEIIIEFYDQQLCWNVQCSYMFDQDLDFLFDEISHGKDAGSTTSRPTNQQLQ